MTALSRRDRAALVLALERLRWRPLPDDEGSAGAIDSAREALSLPRWGCNGVAIGVFRALIGIDTPPRILRARLALALRVLLRADAGDCGPWYCSRGHEWPKRHCDAPDGGPGPGWCFYDVHPGEKAHAARGNRRTRPLWERAPAHGTAPAMRRQR